MVTKKYKKIISAAKSNRAAIEEGAKTQLPTGRGCQSAKLDLRNCIVVAEQEPLPSTLCAMRFGFDGSKNWITGRGKRRTKRKTEMKYGLLLMMMYSLLSMVYGEDFQFSEVYDRGGHVCVDSVFDIGERISILDLEAGKILTAVVVKDTQYQVLEIEMFFPTMIIKTDIEPDTKTNRYIAVNSEISDFDVVRLKYGDCTFSAISISDSLISEALSRDVGCKNYEQDGLDTNFCQKAKLSDYELVRTRIQGLTSGPHFIKTYKGIQIAHSPCSLERERAFTLNKQLYLYSGSGGCECGSYGIELHKIAGGEIREVYKSWKWSM